MFIYILFTLLYIENTDKSDGDNVKIGIERTKKDQKLSINAAELKSKQSVRATFKLHEKTISLLKLSARHLKIKQKTLLDQLLEDESVLELLAEDAMTYSRDENECQFKTFVLGKMSLETLDDICSRHGVPRNFIVELSVTRLASYIDSLAETHQKRRSLLKKIDSCKGQLDNLLEEASTLLQEEDSFLIKLETLTARMARQIQELSKTVKENSEFLY
ncbi:MAG: hypothetical protein KJO60_02990 [Desulfofustis sp.]|nr:hypothetical protein [Desulfofustis sp.]